MRGYLDSAEKGDKYYEVSRNELDSKIAELKKEFNIKDKDISHNYNLDEASKIFSVDDFKKGDVILFKNGEEWLVVDPGMRRSVDRRNSDEITIKPWNDIAKRGHISMAIDFPIASINDEIAELKKK